MASCNNVIIYKIWKILRKKYLEQMGNEEQNVGWVLLRNLILLQNKFTSKKIHVRYL